jgi:hypothetical protein
MTARSRAILAVAAFVMASRIAGAHSGPPYPIVSDRPAGRYLISIWTDPDTTDDGSPGGQFWVKLQAGPGVDAIPQQTRASVEVRPLDRPGSPVAAAAAPVRGDLTNQFAAVVMDHEGRFAVQVRIDGPLGAATVDGVVDATYDLRPPRPLLALYLAPFVAAGLLWGRLLLRRRRQLRS